MIADTNLRKDIAKAILSKALEVFTVLFQLQLDLQDSSKPLDAEFAGIRSFFDSKIRYTISDFNNLSYIACIYDNTWWIGMIEEVKRYKGDIKVNFMHQHGHLFSFFGLIEKMFAGCQSQQCF